MNDHVGKPFKRDELYAVVERWSRVHKERMTSVSRIA
jgi:hypothetical protein